MNKAEACRQALVAANPVFAREPDRLKLFIDQGRIAARRTPAGLGYEWRYRLRIFIEAFESSPDFVMVPLLVWLRDAQPEALLNFELGDRAVTFEADILDEKTADLLIEVELSEAVQVATRPEGGWSVTRPSEPSAEDPLLDGADPDVPLAGITLGAEPLLP